MINHIRYFDLVKNQFFREMVPFTSTVTNVFVDHLY